MRLLQNGRKTLPIQLSEKQEEAVRNLAYPISIVTGGPGTGKSNNASRLFEVYKEAFKKKRNDSLYGSDRTRI